jgi:hypothetical protein
MKQTPAQVADRALDEILSVWLPIIWSSFSGGAGPSSGNNIQRTDGLLIPPSCWRDRRMSCLIALRF